MLPRVASLPQEQPRRGTKAALWLARLLFPPAAAASGPCRHNRGLSVATAPGAAPPLVLIVRARRPSVWHSVLSEGEVPCYSETW